MKLKELVSQRREELQEETKAAEQLWSNKQCAAFVERLVKHGDLQAAKDGRSIPAPTPKESAGKNLKSGSKDNALDGTGSFATIQDLIRFAAECSRENQDTEFFRLLWVVARAL